MPTPPEQPGAACTTAWCFPEVAIGRTRYGQYPNSTARPRDIHLADGGVFDRFTGRRLASIPRIAGRACAWTYLDEPNQMRRIESGMLQK
jgi:hypothetical protein